MTEPEPGPALARIRLSTQLRALREEKPAADVARALRWSPSKLNRIENNKVTISPVEVEALARHYGVRGQADLDQLIQLSVASRQRMWWRREHENFEEDFLNFIAFENDASRLYGYQASCIPALLQTEAYAVAVTASVLGRMPTDPSVRNVVDVRLKRQETLLARLDGEFPPRLSQVIDESVLLRPVGGAAAMEAQFDHLVAMAARPEIRVVVLPFGLGVHPGLGGTFELLTFSEDEDLDVVFIETPATDFLLTDTANTATFHRIMDNLLATDPGGAGLGPAVTRARTALKPPGPARIRE
jgi:uncharacterized protein DUF5753/helix-turn-helix protein